MPTNFPTSLDTFTNPLAGDDVSVVPHHTQHANHNDAITALEAKVGVDGSAVATSLDYLIAHGKLAIGNVVASGTANCVLYIDGSGNLANVSTFSFTSGGGLVVNAVSSNAGTALTATATAPAQTASAQAGVAASLVASDAVAGSSNAGAAAGGDANVTAGAAKRLTSGNANGGNVVLTPGAAIGSGTAGVVKIEQPGGTPGTSEAQLYHDGTELVVLNKSATGKSVAFKDTSTGRSAHIISPKVQGSFNIAGFYTFDDTALLLGQNNGGVMALNSAGSVSIKANTMLGFSSGSNIWDESQSDCGFYRLAAGVISQENASGGATWLQQPAGRKRLTADATESAGTLANISDLSITLKAGRKYFGRLVIFCNESTAADGIQVDFNGGAATMTSFRAVAGVLSAGGAVVAGTNVGTALNTALTFTTWTGEGCFTVEFSLVCNAAGTFIPRFSQVAHSSGTATVRLGSNLFIEDSPN